MSDIVERLRDYGMTLDESVIICDRRVVDEAADTIERLTRELSDTEDNTLLSYLAYIRQKSGVGMKPMLSELADAVSAKISEARTAGRAEGMEEAARYHDSEVATYENQINKNNEYANQLGISVSEANEYCVIVQDEHRLSAAAIRAAKEK